MNRNYVDKLSRKIMNRFIEKIQEVMDEVQDSVKAEMSTSIIDIPPETFGRDTTKLTELTAPIKEAVMELYSEKLCGMTPPLKIHCSEVTITITWER